ncbi:MAG: aspartyl protease family protein [Nitrospira sp. BO4]|jgi:hypothetical protein|nr:aspartyl protease family protein [Nitrospira sp. BO4]
MHNWHITLCVLPFIGVLVAGSLPPVSAGDLVRWTDENGVLHFSDSLANVPPRYRGHIKLEKLKEEEVPKESRSGRNLTKAQEIRAVEPASEPFKDKPKLNSYEVPFEAYEGTAQRVIVSVKFNDSVTVPMALDTGAPGLVISPKLANQLGLFSGDEGKVEVQAGGIGGSVTAIRTFIDKVQIGEASDIFIPATVTRSVSPAFEGLVGMDFMSKYSFKIDSVKHVVIFEEIEPNPNWPGGRPERWWRERYKELHALRAAWRRAVPHEQQWQAQYGPAKFASNQVMEVDKLLDKLDRYANQHFVPQSWR